MDKNTIEIKLTELSSVRRLIYRYVGIAFLTGLLAGTFI